MILKDAETKDYNGYQKNYSHVRSEWEESAKGLITFQSKTFLFPQKSILYSASFTDISNSM